MTANPTLHKQHDETQDETCMVDAVVADWACCGSGSIKEHRYTTRAWLSGPIQTTDMGQYCGFVVLQPQYSLSRPSSTCSTAGSIKNPYQVNSSEEGL